MYAYKATVRSVYDADTIRVNVDLGFGTHNFGEEGKGLALRLYGINAPEMRGAEKVAGKAARDYVRMLIPVGTEIIIKTHKDKTGKYGRYLAEVFVTDADGKEIHLNSHLIAVGHAKAATY